MDEKERLEEDLNIVLDEIEHCEQLARDWEFYGEKAPDFIDLDELESHINTLNNEASYYQHCLDDYD